MTERPQSAQPEGQGDPAADAVDPFVRFGPAIGLTVVAMGFLLRVRGLSEYWLNPDEGIYYSTLTRGSLSEFWAEVSANAHPPLFYLLLRGAGMLTWDFVWLRGLSVVCGTVAIWAIWLAARELGGRGRAGVVAGLVAAGLLAVNAEAITLSQVMRPYMIILALLALALFHLLRYRTDPSGRRLALYLACVCPAVLIHYSAALAFASFCVVVAYYHLSKSVDPRAWRRLALTQVVPAVVFGSLYLWHLSATMGSDLIGDALGSGGWLSQWLVRSPGDAWFSFATYQVFHVPPELRGRAALFLLAALSVAMVRNRLVAVVVGAGLSAALAASVLGLYPFGGSRHNVWLVVFTLPALGWLVGDLIGRGRRASWVAAAVLALALVVGGPIERVFGSEFAYTNATDEKVIRQVDLAPLVVPGMDPEAEPDVILMSEQPYDLLMPLYADQREDARFSVDSAVFAFTYGTRTVVVARHWDWNDVDEVRAALVGAGTVPGVPPVRDETVFLVAGGWGSGLFAHIPELEASGALLDAVRVFGQDPAGDRIVRMVGMVLNTGALGGRP